MKIYLAGSCTRAEERVLIRLGGRRLMSYFIVNREGGNFKYYKKSGQWKVDSRPRVRRN